MQFSRVNLCLALLAVGGACALAGADVYQYRFVAKTGDAAPGTAGTFTDFATPNMNSYGQVAFQAENTAIVGASGLWVTPAHAPLTLEAIAIQDTTPPNVPNGVKYGAFVDVNQHPLLNDDGDIGFSSWLTGIGPDAKVGLFRRMNGAVEKVAIPGDQAPGMSPGVVFDSVSTLPSFNENGLMAFTSRLTGPGITPDNDDVIYMHWFGGLNQFMREGWGATGMAGTTYNLYEGNTLPTIDNTGKIALATDLDGAQASDWSVWTGYPGAHELVAKTGDASPSGHAYGSSFNSFWGARQGANGLAFTQNVDNGGSLQSGMYYFDGNAIEEVMREDTLGPIGFYDPISWWEGWINADGDVAFESGFSFFGLSQNVDSAIVLKRPGDDAMIIAREGDQPYGFGAGVEFDDLRNAYAILNDYESVLISGSVRGPGINADNDQAAWVYSSYGAKHLVIREGQMMDVGGGVMKQVDAFNFRLSNNMNSGRRPGLNNRGDVALRVYFTDATQAVVVAQLPPPCSADLNHDNWIDVQDLLILLGAWGPGHPVGEGGDVNWDGTTDVLDLLELLAQWGPCV